MSLTRLLRLAEFLAVGAAIPAVLAFGAGYALMGPLGLPNGYAFSLALDFAKLTFHGWFGCALMLGLHYLLCRRWGDPTFHACLAVYFGVYYGFEIVLFQTHASMANPAIVADVVLVALSFGLPLALASMALLYGYVALSARTGHRPGASAGRRGATEAPSDSAESAGPMA